MIKNIEHNNLLQFENLSKLNSLLHFSTTILGGVSTGQYDSFNLGLYSGDKAAHVIENRKRLAQMLEINISDLYLPKQTHEDNICVIDNDFVRKSASERLEFMYSVDAVITDQKNICIGVTTADCVPILIYDPKRNILAVVHAGWRGTVAKLSQKTVQMMVKRFNSDPQDLVVGIAPSISPEYFEVGDEVIDTFRNAGFDINDIAYKNIKTGKYHIDLWLANKLILGGVGVCLDNIEVAGICTYSNSDKFFSARRQTIHSGRMVTGGMLK